MTWRLRLELVARTPTLACRHTAARPQRLLRCPLHAGLAGRLAAARSSAPAEANSNPPPAQVERMAKQLGVAGDVAYTCETAAHFWLLHVLARWEKFLADAGAEHTDACVQARPCAPAVTQTAGWPTQPRQGSPARTHAPCGPALRPEQPPVAGEPQEGAGGWPRVRAACWALRAAPAGRRSSPSAPTLRTRPGACSGGAASRRTWSARGGPSAT